MKLTTKKNYSYLVILFLFCFSTPARAMFKEFKKKVEKKVEKGLDELKTTAQQRFASKPTSTTLVSPVPQPQAESDTFDIPDAPASPSATSLIAASPTAPDDAMSESPEPEQSFFVELQKFLRFGDSRATTLPIDDKATVLPTSILGVIRKDPKAALALRQIVLNAETITNVATYVMISSCAQYTGMHPEELLAHLNNNSRVESDIKLEIEVELNEEEEKKEKEANKLSTQKAKPKTLTNNQAMKSCTTTAAHVAGSCARSLLGAELTPTDSKFGFKIGEQFKKMGAGLGETLNDCAKAGELLADPKPSEFRQNITTIGKVAEKFADRLAKCLTKSPKKTVREGESKENAESKQHTEQLQQQANQEGERKWQTEQVVVNGDGNVNKKHNVNEKVEENKKDAEDIESLSHLIGVGSTLEHIEKIAENLKNITQKFEQATTDPKTRAEAIETAQNLIKNLTAASFSFVADPKNQAEIEEVAKRLAEIAKTLEPSVTNITDRVITQASREMEKSFWWTRIFLNTTLLSIAAFFVITTYGRWLNLPPRTLLQAT